ncbi:MAG: hypothetical protein ACOYLQ_10855 [Hyphomicrobiaceae bacterium]|jgi:hypothetical protein
MRLVPRATALLVLALLVGPAAAQSPSGGSSADKLAACRKAALENEGSTDFKCDWKTVVAGAPGAALTGRFTYLAKGMAGEMTILEGGGEDALIAIETVTKDRNAHTCSAGLRARRAGDALVAKPEDAQGCVVTVKSSKTVNVVDVTATEACQFYCGMRAVLDGRYRLKK